MTYNDYLQIINENADYWRYDIGVNVIPANSKSKASFEKWEPWQSNPIPQQLHEQWKSEGRFKDGIAIIPGKVYHNKEKEGLYLVSIDLDNQKAIDEVCSIFGASTLEELSKNVIVEQHLDNKSKAHLYFYSNHAFKKKSSDVSKFKDMIDSNEIPAIEVKGQGEHGIVVCTPSIHQNGHPYTIICTKEPKIYGKDIEEKLEETYQKYELVVNSEEKVSIELLFDSNFKVLKGHNRHEALLRVMESLIQKFHKEMDESEIKDLAYKWNQKHCEPSLSDKEFDRQWKCAKEFIERKKLEYDLIDNQNYENLVSSLSIFSNTASKTKEKPLVDKLVELASSNINLLFKNQYGVAYAQVNIGGKNPILKIDSSRFKKYLNKLYTDTHKRVVNSEAVSNAISHLEAKAEFEGPTLTLNLRVAWCRPEKRSSSITGGISGDFRVIYYDLTDDSWRCIKITSKGWSIERETPIPLFTRYHPAPQAEPSSTYDDKIFDRFFELTNIKDEDDRLLLKCYIISLFFPEISKPVLMLHGEHGSAKSTFLEFIKMLVDPSILKTLSIPKDKNELIQQLDHNFIAFYDNLTSLPEWVSDELCRAVTGSGSSKRQLYSDDDDIIYTFKRCIGLGGINLAATKPDLLDRGIIVKLERILDKFRIKEDEVWNDFNSLKPQLLGFIFDILVKVLKFKESGKQINLKEYPRMADFAEIAEIISVAMGEKEGRFMQVYFDNIKLQTEEAIQANPVGEAIVYFVNTFEKKGIRNWSGTSSQLLSELEGIAHDLRINTSSKAWPKAANSLSRRLKEVKTNLRQLGILVENDKDLKTGARTLNVRKISSISSESPERQNHAQNEGKITGDTLDDILDTKSNIAGKNSEIHAQNDSSGDTGGLDDISGTLGAGVGGSTKTNHDDELLKEMDFYRMLPNNVGEELDELIAYEKSPFKPIIKRKENFYYCSLHPQVPNIHLDEIERHCRLKEPDLHKSKILEFEKENESANENEDE